MRSHKGMMVVLMLTLSLGALGLSAIINLSPMAVGIQNPVLELNEEFELAYVPHDAVEIHNNQDMIDQATAESWPGDGSKETPYVITGYSFNQDTQPLRIWNTDLYWIFTGNLVTSDGEGQQCGCWIENVTNGVLTDNEINTRHTGLYIMDIENFNLTDNIIHGNQAFGIEIIDGAVGCNISGNTVYDCPQGGIRIPHGAQNTLVCDNLVRDCGGTGIMVTGGDVNSIVARNTVLRSADIGIAINMATGTTVSFNTVVNSSDHGLLLFALTDCSVVNNVISGANDDGVSVVGSEFSNISMNTISDCIGVGIDVDQGENTTLSWNTIQRSDEYAIQLSDTCENYDVSYNTFEENGATCQICDEGINNDICFNYYSDWTSPDVDANGIVDNPYALDGAVGNADPYPLAEAGVVPEIEEPTTSPSEPTPLPMEFLLIGAGAVLVIVIISGAVMLRKR